MTKSATKEHAHSFLQESLLPFASLRQGSALPYRHLERSPRSLLFQLSLPAALYLLHETPCSQCMGIQVSLFLSHAHTTSCRKQQRSLHFGRDDRWKTGNLTSSFTPLCGSILRLWRGPFGLTGRRLNGQARRLFGLGQTRKSLCGTSVSKGLLISLL